MQPSSQSSASRREQLFCRLRELKRESLDIERELALHESLTSTCLPTSVEQVMSRLITRHSADLLSVHAANGDYVFVSPNAESLFGWSPPELVGRSADELIHEDDLERVTADDFRQRASGDDTPKLRYRILCRNGTHRWVETRSRATADRDFIVAITRDIHTEVLAAEENKRAAAQLAAELRRSAYHDPLTGLPNRRALEEALEGELGRSRRKSSAVALAIFDVDRFKTINDRFGHVRGDEILRDVGERIASSKRAYDVAGRWGGDEFLLILPETSAADGVRVAQRVRTAIGSLGLAETERVTVSGGVGSSADAESVDALLRLADRALLRAKRSGRDAVAWELPIERRVQASG